MIVDAAPAMTGSLMAARREAAALSDRSRFQLVVPATCSVPDKQLPEFERVHRIDLPTLGRSAGKLIRFGPALMRCGARLAALLREEGCSRLQMNDFILAQGAAVRLFGYRGRIVTWVRMDPSRESLAYGLLLRLAHFASNELVSVSKFVRSHLPARYRARLIYDPVPSTEGAVSGSPSNNLLFIANYIEGKGQDAAIRTFHHVAPDFPTARLIFHGGDMGLKKNRAYLSRLKDLAQAGPARDRIVFGEFIQNTASLLRNSLAALNLSHSESFSLTCQEASAAGVAVIATRCGGPEEIVENGISGWLVSVDDDAAVEAAMREALADPDATRARGRRGAELVQQRFGVEPFREALTELFALPFS